MTKLSILPMLAAALLTAACGDDADSITPPPTDARPSVRFFNAMTGMTSSGGFTTNGQFAAGSALTFGQSTQPCARLDPGLTTFGFGAVNTGRTALSGNTLATLPNQTIMTGGDFTVAAVGNGVHSELFMLANSFTGTLGGNQAAVRFVNLAAASDPFNVMVVTGSGQTTHATNLAVGTASTFATFPGGTTAFSILHGEEGKVAITGGPGTLNLQGGSVNTVAIVHAGAMGAGFKLINLPRCS